MQNLTRIGTKRNLTGAAILDPLDLHASRAARLRIAVRVRSCAAVWFGKPIIRRRGYQCGREPNRVRRIDLERWRLVVRIGYPASHVFDDDPFAQLPLR